MTTAKIALVEDLFGETLIENETTGKDTYIKGIFAQANVVNRNKRIYPEEIMDREINSYIENCVNKSRAVGELNHPDNRLTIDPLCVSHNIVELKKDGTNYIGKAKILKTPRGEIVKGLIEGGVQLGVSTRGYGSVKKIKSQISEVQNDYKMVCVDIVYAPSAPDAFVDTIVESEILEKTFESNLLEEEFESWLKFRQMIKEQKDANDRFILASNLFKSAYLKI